MPFHLAPELLGEISPRLEAQLTVEIVEKHGGAVGMDGPIEAVQAEVENLRFRAWVGRLRSSGEAARMRRDSFGHLCECLQVLEGGISSVSTGHMRKYYAPYSY